MPIDGSASSSRTLDFEYDTETRTVWIRYDPDNSGGARRDVTVQPWTGSCQFLVDEAQAAGCAVWTIRVCVEWDPHDGTPGELKVRYELEDYDCRELARPARE